MDEVFIPSATYHGEEKLKLTGSRKGSTEDP
jgi:hypothetical protein